MARTRSHAELLDLLAKLPANVTGLKYNKDGSYEVSLAPAGREPAATMPAKSPLKEVAVKPRAPRDIDSLRQGLPEFGVVEEKREN